MPQATDQKPASRVNLRTPDVMAAVQRRWKSTIGVRLSSTCVQPAAFCRSME
jgi:hypothetical protein